MTTTTKTRKPYTTERITGGVAIYHGEPTRLGDAVRIVATDAEATKWIAGKSRGEGR